MHLPPAEPSLGVTVGAFCPLPYLAYWGNIGDHGKEHGNYYIIIGYILGFSGE